MPTLGKSFAFIDKVNMLLRQNLEPCSHFFLDDFKYLKPIRENSSVETAYKR